MGSEKVLLAHLQSNSRVQYARLQVVKKFDPMQNVGRAKFQRFVLKDEKGDKIRLTLFGEYIEIYGTILQEDAFYDISNVSIKEGNIASPYPQGKLMYVNDCSSIVVVANVAPTGAFSSSYLSLRDTFRIDSEDESFDVVAVVVQVGVVEEKTTMTGRTTQMLKFHVSDDSCSDVVEFVVWDAMAHDVANIATLSRDKGELLVVGFKGIRKNFYRGTYSFTSHFESRVSFSPEGPRVQMVKEWLKANTSVVESRQQTFLASLQAKTHVDARTIADALSKKANELTVGTLFKIHAFIQDFEETCIRAALGCKFCGKGCDVSIGGKYVCISCKRSTSCVAKLYFDFTAQDATGSLLLSAQTRTAEFILGIKAHAFYKKTPEERGEFFRATQDSLRGKSFPLVVTPVSSLLTNHGFVKWSLKYVEKE